MLLADEDMGGSGWPFDAWHGWAYNDKYGRIKVQFYWDRYGKKDENSSCWIRVAHLWAGKGWGGQHIPRIGQEVMVEFLEGDPDQPIRPDGYLRPEWIGGGSRGVEAVGAKA